MSQSNSSNGGGIGLFGATFLVLLVLKLTNNISCSWLWVTAPLWGGLALLFLLTFIVLWVRS